MAWRPEPALFLVPTRCNPSYRATSATRRIAPPPYHWCRRTRAALGADASAGADRTSQMGWPPSLQPSHKHLRSPARLSQLSIEGRFIEPTPISVVLAVGSDLHPRRNQVCERHSIKIVGAPIRPAQIKKMAFSPRLASSGIAIRASLALPSSNVMTAGISTAPRVTTMCRAAS